MEKFETLNELIVALLFWITTNTEYKEPKKISRSRVSRTKGVI